MNNLVDIIKEHQEQEHLTDQQFTDLLGVHRSTWAKVKSGKRNPGFKLLRAFDQQFPSVEIFNRVSSTTPHQTAQNKVLGGLRFLGRKIIALFARLPGPNTSQSTKSKTRE